MDKRMYWYRIFLTISLTIISLQTYAGGKDEVIFKGRIFEHVEKVDTGDDEEGANDNLKDPPIVKNYKIFLFNEDGVNTGLYDSKKGSFKVPVPRKKITYIIFYAQDFETILVEFNTENISTRDDDWEKYSLNFEFKISVPREPMDLLSIEWNNGQYIEREEKYKDRKITDYYRGFAESESGVMDAGSIVPQIYDKSLNGNTEDNKLPIEREKKKRVKKKLPIYNQMGFDLGQTKEKLGDISLEKEIVLTSMEAEEMVAVVIDDPKIEALLEESEATRKAFLDSISLEYDRYYAMVKSREEAIKKYSYSERNRQAEPLVESLTDFYPDSIPAHFQDELNSLLEQFKEETGEDFTALNNDELFQKKDNKTSTVEDGYSRREEMMAKYANQENGTSDQVAVNYNGGQEYAEGGNPESIGGAVFFDDPVNDPRENLNETQQEKLRKKILAARNAFKKEIPIAMNSSSKSLSNNDSDFESQFSEVFNEGFEKAFNQAFGIELDSEFLSDFKSSFKDLYESSDKSEFKEKFSESFNEAFEEAYKSNFDHALSPGFKMKFTKSFNKLYTGDGSSKEDLKKAFDPAFQEAMTSAIPNLVKHTDPSLQSDADKLASKANKAFKNNHNKFIEKGLDGKSFSISNGSFNRDFASMFNESFNSMFEEAFDAKLGESFTKAFENQFKANFKTTNPNNFEQEFTKAFNIAMEKAYKTEFNAPLPSSFKNEFKQVFEQSFDENNSLNFKGEFKPAYEKAINDAILTISPKMAKSVLEKSHAGAREALDPTSELAAQASQVFEQEYQTSFNTSLGSQSLKFEDDTFLDNFNNAFGQSIKSTFKKAFGQPLERTFVQNFFDEFNVKFKASNSRSESPEFDDIFQKSFSESFAYAYKEQYGQELDPKFEQIFKQAFNSKFSQDNNESLSKAFKKAFAPSFEEALQPVISDLAEYYRPSESTSAGRMTSNSEYTDESKKIIQEKYNEELSKLNTKSKKLLEDNFFNEFKDNYGAVVKYNYDPGFEDDFTNSFINSLSPTFNKMFNRSLSEDFKASFKTEFKSLFDENTNPEDFKTNFKKAFTKAFAKAYEDHYNQKLNDRFRTSFNQSFNSLFLEDPNMPFSQTFERAFSPSFELALNNGIPQTNEFLHGNEIMDRMEKLYRKKKPIQSPSSSSSTDVLAQNNPSSNSNSANGKSKEQLMKEKGIKIIDQSTATQSNTKKQKTQLTVASSVGGKVENPNQELYDSESVKAYIHKLRTNYNPVDVYSFMIDTTEIIVTKYRTPEGVFEVLADRDNRVQMLKNNIIITGNVFGKEQQDYHKKLDKMSSVEVPYNQVSKAKYATEKGLIFRVQVAAVSKKGLQIFNPLKIYGNLIMDKQDKIYKYMIGDFYQLSELKEVKAQIKKTIPDAFTVAYYHGQRITMKRALQLLLGEKEYAR